MITPTLVGIASIGLSLSLARLKGPSLRLSIAFLPVFLFLALRYNYGNDYLAYLDLFEDVASQSHMSYEPGTWHAEIGWLALNRLFAGIGFFPMIAVLALFNCYLYARFIRRFVPEHYYWLAIFLYIFVPENMLVQASAMRQAVAISLFLLAVEFLIERRLLAYIACVVVASSFHTSAIVLLPVYLLGARWIVIKKWLIPIFVALYFFFLYFSEQLLSSMLAASTLLAGADIFDRYLQYEEKGVIGSGLGMMLALSYLTILLYLHDEQSNEGRVIFRLLMVGLYVSVLSTSLMILARIAFYFSVMSIVATPLVVDSIRSAGLKVSFVLLQVLYTSYIYVYFFHSPIYRSGYGVYTSIISII